LLFTALIQGEAKKEDENRGTGMDDFTKLACGKHMQQMNG
jgi:hypothetical protein